MKLCQDCRFCRYDEAAPRWSVCQHPDVHYPGMVDYVSGQPGARSKLACNDARRDTTLCGPDGRLWEAKPDA